VSEPGTINSELLVFNGIDGTTGDYLVPPLPPQTLARIAMGEEWTNLSELDYRRKQQEEAQFVIEEGRDPNDLAQAGWGVIFAADADPKVNAAIREALSELLEHRKRQAGPLYREYLADGYRQRDRTKDEFLKRHKIGPGPVQPKKMPYYLLIVADPQSIPYQFQYELDVAYAVGRIHFNTLDEYAQYARSVVTAETPGKVGLPRHAAFVGTANPGDQATNISAELLIKPLVERLAQSQVGWQVENVQPAKATKQHLLELLGSTPPALLFTASHGMGYPNGHQNQLAYQGALLCQDWPGPALRRKPQELPRDYFLAGEDITDDMCLLGMIAFHFACFGAGTPYWDDFARKAFKTRAAMAPHAFVAALPQKLLSRPKGGALAVVGHVERAWTYSFKWAEAGAQTAAFDSTLKRLMGDTDTPGETIGWALDYVNIRYAEIATMLSGMLDLADVQPPDPYKLADMWTANNDARGYAILGDPAVRLPVVSGDTTAAEHPPVGSITSRPGTVPPVLVTASIPAVQLAASAAPEPGSGATTPSSPNAPSFDRPVAAPNEAVAFFPGEETVQQIRDSLTSALGQMAARLAAFMQEIATLEVATFVSDGEGAQYDSSTDQFTTGAKLRALTRISFDGDMKVCVPRDAGQIDQALWAIHTSMIQQAQANRTAMLKTAAEVLSGLLGLKAG
jgi:hypothetical protein